MDPREQMRRLFSNGLLLALPELGPELEYVVISGQGLPLLEFEQHIRSHNPRTGTEFEHVGPAQFVDDLRDLAGDAPGEHR